jgi:hypothetical protein
LQTATLNAVSAGFLSNEMPEKTKYQITNGVVNNEKKLTFLKTAETLLQSSKATTKFY